MGTDYCPVPQSKRAVRILRLDVVDLQHSLLRNEALKCYRREQREFTPNLSPPESYDVPSYSLQSESHGAADRNLKLRAGCPNCTSPNVVRGPPKVGPLGAGPLPQFPDTILMPPGMRLFQASCTLILGIPHHRSRSCCRPFQRQVRSANQPSWMWYFFWNGIVIRNVNAAPMEHRITASISTAKTGVSISRAEGNNDSELLENKLIKNTTTKTNTDNRTPPRAAPS